MTYYLVEIENFETPDNFPGHDVMRFIEIGDTFLEVRLVAIEIIWARIRRFVTDDPVLTYAEFVGSFLPHQKTQWYEFGQKGTAYYMDDHYGHGHGTVWTVRIHELGAEKPK